MKKIFNKIHLWIGLIVGSIIIIIALTGCIYAFQEEIQNLSQDFRFVEKENKAFLAPSEIVKIAQRELPKKELHAIMYKSKSHAVSAIFYGENYYDIIYINPYSGKVLKVNDENSGFFHFILEGHFYLWLPEHIGQPVVAISTLLFLVLIISGIYLWWPRNKNARKQRFKYKMDGSWKRKNYDLHSVTGFYICVFALIFTITGLVWGFQWFSNSYYSLITGGKTMIHYKEPVSSIKYKTNFSKSTLDLVWEKMNRENPNAKWIEVHPPHNKKAVIAANSNPDLGTYWKTDYRYFDQYSMKEIDVKHLYGRFKNLSDGDKLMRMNYDIHVGGVFGLMGKILAFLISLLISTMPISGFLIWKGRKKRA